MPVVPTSVVPGSYCYRCAGPDPCRANTAFRTRPTGVGSALVLQAFVQVTARNPLLDPDGQVTGPVPGEAKTLPLAESLVVALQGAHPFTRSPVGGDALRGG